MQFQLDEVRRLTGPNLLSDRTGAIIDVLFSGVDNDVIIACWHKHLHHCQVALGADIAWPSETYTRVYEGGCSMSISAPMDLLYSACDLMELAWDLCTHELQQAPQANASVDISSRLAALKDTVRKERQPHLLDFLHHAQINNTVCLVDDDDISLGLGASSQTWPIAQFPSSEQVNWSQYKTIPLALITGTNGKSTSVRLAAEIAKAASLSAGVTSTDFIKVGNTIIDEGDYSGPGGARMLLRDKRTEIAFLEVARGGLLRRGLPVHQANAALVTNVAADHLGQYGINTVEEIAKVKTMVAKAIASGSNYDNGVLVLNADDPLLVEASKQLNVPICWFSTDKLNPKIIQAIEAQHPCVFVDEQDLVYSASETVFIAKVKDIPITVNGTAKHNIQNALGVIGLCKGLKIQTQFIRQGLEQFGLSVDDNPGRGNIYTFKDATVIVDFAHNPHSMQAVINMAKQMPAQRRHVMFSHAGDRSDQDILGVAQVVNSIQPTSFVLAELEHYLRGRELYEISNIVKSCLLNEGVSADDIVIVNNPLQGAKHLLDKAQAGDLILLFVLNEREKVQTLIESAS